MTVGATPTRPHVCRPATADDRAPLLLLHGTGDDEHGLLPLGQALSPGAVGGGLRWAHVGRDSMTYLREHPDQRLLVHVARAEHPPVRIALVALGLVSADQLVPLSGALATAVGSDTVQLPSAGPAASAYLLQPGS